VPHSAKGRILSAAHAAIGAAVLATNLLAAGWGGFAWLRSEPSVAFWYLLRAAQAVVALQVVLGFILLARGSEPPDGLHVLYGLSPLFITLVSEGMRAGAAQSVLEEIDDLDALAEDERRAVARQVVLRETGVMTIGALLIVTLSLRAMSTGGFV